MRPARCPRPSPGPAPARSSAMTAAHHVVAVVGVRRSAASSRHAPRECISTTPAPAPRPPRGHAGIEAQRRDVVDDGGAGVERRPRHAGLDGVHRERQLPGSRARAASTTGTTRAISSSSRHLRDAARAGWIPRRRRASPRHRAPAPPRARAPPPRPASWPPSLKLSGVTLRMPTMTGRSSAMAPAGRLPRAPGSRPAAPCPTRGGEFLQRLRHDPGPRQRAEARAGPATTAQSSPVITSRPRLPPSATRASRVSSSRPVKRTASGSTPPAAWLPCRPSQPRARSSSRTARGEFGAPAA